MKKILIIIALVFGFSMNAQNNKNVSKETKTTTTTTWYTEPWVWIVGGAVFILILIALLRGGSSRDRDVSKTTVIRD